MRLLLLILGFVVAISSAQGQNRFGVQGSVEDSANHYPLVGASVVLLRASDSSRVNLQVAGEEGQFKFKSLAQGTYLITISYVGYQTLVQSFVVLTAQTALDLGVLKLRPKPNNLAEIIVRRRLPVSFRRDTLLYDAGAFTTSAHAVVEDLLRKLPGLEVDGSGAVRAQGQGVQQVLVDGKPFFGNDLRMATRNLPAALIDQIQVYNKRSDASTFSGIDDGSRMRVINIITKPAAHGGQFGQQAAGGGTTGRYQLGAGLHRFDARKQFSLLGQANNLNQTGSSLPTLGRQSGSGSGESTTLGQPGSITRSVGGGINYSAPWGKRLEVATSYQVSRATTLSQQDSRRTLLPAGNSPQRDTLTPSVVSESGNRTLSQPTLHSGNLNLNYRLDSMNTLRIVPGLSRYITTTATQTTTQTRSGSGGLLNQSRLDNQTTASHVNATNTLLWLHRFRRPGHTLSLAANTALSQGLNGGTNRSQNTYVRTASGIDSLDAAGRNQRVDQATYGTKQDLTLTYGQALSARHSQEWHYQLTTEKSRSTRTVLDANEQTGAYDRLNADLSSQYRRRFETHRLGTIWQWNRPKYILTLGGDVQRAVLRTAYVRPAKGELNRQYLNLLPQLMFQPQLPANHSFQIQYQTQVTAPSVLQLQPVADVSNPLLIQKGNPALRPEYTHLLVLNYNQFETTSYRTLSALLTLGLTDHRIVNSTTIDAAGVQIMEPLNANGYLTTNGSLTMSRPLGLGGLKGNLNWNTGLLINRGVSYINQQANRSLMLTLGQGLNWNATSKGGIEVNLGARFTYQAAHYSLQPGVSQHSLNTTLSSQLYWPLPKGFKVATDVSCLTLRGRSAGYNQTYSLWNGYVSRSLLKNQGGELRLQVFDLLNQNRSLVRTVTDTYVEDVRSQVLRRYVLLSFIYNLRQFGGR